MGKSRPGRAGEPEADGMEGATRSAHDENGTLRSLESTLDTHTRHFEKILSAIKDTKCVLEAKIDTVALDVG